jgi:cyclopropane fatty-acyl-phospholipid synthase-like methyltransferase
MDGEPQYRDAIALMKEIGVQRMGLHASWAYYDDPRRLTFTFARYKFAAKMLAGAKRALEIGCADGFASRIVRQVVDELVCVDFDPEFIVSAQETASPRWPIEFRLHDVLAAPIEGEFDALLSLDVLEHIRPEDERRFLTNALAPLTRSGAAVIGMPSLNSQAYASALSREGHVNCKHQQDFKNLMSRFFDHVFMFSMNDEVVHTGHPAMSHYHLALCCSRKQL